MNALRLNLIDPYDGSRDRNKGKLNMHELNKIITNENIKEEYNMTTTLKIEGMMCPHCEVRVKKALEGVAGVESAVADHNAGTAVVTMSAEVPFEELKNVVEAEDYKVL